MKNLKETLETIGAYALVGGVAALLGIGVVWSAKYGTPENVDGTEQPDTPKEPEEEVEDPGKFYTVADAVKAIADSDMTSCYKSAAISVTSAIPRKLASPAIYEAIAYTASADSMLSVNRLTAIKEICLSVTA